MKKQKQESPYKRVEERPLRNKAPNVYERGAVQADKQPLVSTRPDYEPQITSIQNKRNAAIREMIENEDKHFGTIHPFVEPQADFTGKKKEKKGDK